MITEEMKHTEHYRMYVEVFGFDVPLTQSQPTESTQGTHRTPSAPRSPTPKTDTSESSAPKQSTVIHFHLPERRSTHLTPPVPVPNVEKADEIILQDTLQVSLAEHKSREEQEARENVELVNNHLASEEIEKLVEGSENVIDDSLPPKNDEPQIPDTRLDPRSDKESLEVERTNVEERREKGKIVEESRSTSLPTPIRSPRTHTNLVSSDTEKLQELTVTHTQTTSSSRSQHTKLSRANRLLSLFKVKPARFKRYKNFFQELQGRYTYLFEHLKERFLSRKSFDTLADHLQEVMVESLPTMVDTHIKELVKKQVPKQVRDQVLVYVEEGLILERQKTKEEMEQMIAKAILQERGNIQAEISLQIQKAIDNQIPSQVDTSVRSYMSGHILHVHPVQSQTQSVPEQQYQLYLSMKNDPQPSAVRPRDQDDPHDDAHPEGENSAKRQKTSEYEANQEQEDDYDFWTDSYASDDDELPSEQVSQDIMEEISLTIDEAKLKKMADEMLRQRCTSADEHQYHIDQMKNFLKSDIVWESRKEILVSPHPRKTTPLVQSCQRDPEAPALSLINQDLLYLKKGSSGPEKIVLSLHKFPAIIFNDDDIEERTSRWVNKCVKKFNPYARYGVEHWKNPHAKIFYIRKQKEPGKPKRIVARRANECIVSITEPDYKNLNKNDIEDMYLLIMNGKVPDYAETGLLWSLSVFIRSSVIWERVHDFQLGIESYQQKVNLTAPTISFPRVEKHRMFSIIYEPVHGIIYKNSKKEKRVMRHSEIHKFCDATLNRVLEGLKSYNNDVKYGYVQRELTNDEVEYLKLFEEEIKVRLKYRNQMRRWEMYVNGRPLGPRREHPKYNRP
ncbi:hypothetical protein Tco_0952585 [Tanacetum coccineum]|uniref:Histone deacetylase interacting domain-containing protein n=1 Tax=Tanacetum coccineum TaxID=301880 RepID=A0ABQ5DXS7_9ASTR